MAGGLALVCAFCQWKIEHKESESVVEAWYRGIWLGTRGTVAVFMKVFTRNEWKSTGNK